MGLLDSYGDQLPDLMPDVGQNQKPETQVMPEPPKLRSAMRVTQGMQPDQLANDMRMGKTVGLPADFVAADREAVKQKIEEDNAEQALAGAPATRNYLAGNPHTMALTKDDLPNAARLEAILTGEIQPSRTSDPKLAVGLDGTPYLDYSSVPTDQSTGFDWLFKSASQALKAGGYNTAYGLKAYGHMVAGTDPTKDQALMALLDEAKQAPQANGLLEKMWTGGFGAIPMLGSGMLRGATYGAAASGMAGLAAAPLAGGLAATGVGAPAGAAVEGGATAAAGAAGFTFGMFHDIYMQTSGAKYAELIQQGVDPATAQKTAMAVGGVNAALMSARFSPAWLSKLPVIGPALEKAGAQQAIDQVLAQPTVQAAAKDFIVHVAKDTGKNGVLGASMAVVDQLGTAAAMGVQQGLEGQDLLRFIGTQASSPEFWQHAAESGKSMAIDMAGFAVIPGARGLVRDFQAVERAKVDRAVFEALDENVGQSKLRERMPDAHADLVEAIREQNGGTMPENVYVDPKALREASGLQGDTFYQMLTQIGVDPADFNRSEALDAPLAIPMKDYASRVAGTDLSAKLRDDMKFDPEGMTAREAQAFEAERDARVTELKQQYEQNKEQHDADFEAAKQEKFDQLMNGAELQGGVKMTRADAEAQLAPMFKMAERAAERWRAMGYDVTAADLLRKAHIQWEEPGRQRIEPKPGIPGIDRISDISLMNMADAGVGDVPLSIFHGDKDLVRKLGLVYEERIADPETGEMRPVEMVNTAPLWAERKRRNDIETSSRKAPTAEEINASIERRAQWYEKLAKEQEDLGDLGDQERESSLRKMAADTRARKQPEGRELNQYDRADLAGADLNDPAIVADAQKQWAEKGTESPYFKQWVGDGNFVKGFHGTGADIAAFAPKNMGNKGSHLLDIGTHVSLSPEVANMYAKAAENGGRYQKGLSSGAVKGNPAVYPLYARYSNILDATKLYPDDIKAALLDKHSDYFKGGKAKTLINADPLLILSDLQSKMGKERFKDFLSSLGFDAVKYEWGGVDNIVVFSPEQIKSVFNRGTFDSSDPRILMQSIGDRIATALKDTSGPKPEAEVALPPSPDTLYQVQNLPEWRDKTSAWMEKNGYSAEEIQKHLAAIDGQMKIFQALGPAELEMLPQGAGNNPGKGKGPIRTNADPIYKITFDASAMCVKRLEAAATATYVQAQLGRALTTSERMALVALFRAAGKAAPCVYCYVEAPRSKSGEFVKTATDVALGQAPKDSWSDSLKQAALEAQAEAKQLGLKPGDIDPNVVLDPEYAQSAEARAKLEQAPKVYQFLKSQMLAAKANLPKLYEEYNGQILDLDQKLLNELNSYAGLRFFSSSDFQAEHVADLMQAVHDMDVRQAKAHAYTKVPDFVRIFGDTGIKIQTSIFAKEEGGKIVMDDWQGMNWDEAKAFREKHANVGTVLVASSDNIVAWALKQPWIDYIIPFHYSGLEKKFYGTLGWEDFTSTQSEKALGGGKAEKIRQHETGSAEGITNEQGTRNYLTLAMERKLIPVFPAFMFKDFVPGGDRAKQTRDAVARWTEMVNKGEIDWSQINPEYYKLRKDYARTDTPFDAVKAKVDLDAAGEVLDKYMAGETPKAQVDPQIADKLVGMIKGAEGSNRDIGVEALQAAKANRELFQAAYHGSPHRFSKFSLDHIGGGPRILNQEPVQKKDLVAAHNLSEQNLQFADKIGGLPVPSIGITKAATPFDGFGNITLIGHKDMVDPSRGVPVFSADAYSARFPEVLWPKVKTKDAQRFMNESRPYFDEFKDGGASNVWDSLVNSPNRDRALEDFTRGGMLGARAMYADQVLGKKVTAPMRDVPHEHLFIDEQLIKDAKDLRYEDVEPGGKDAHTFAEAVKNAIDRSFTQQMEQAGESTFRKNAAERLKEAYLSRFFKDGELTYAGADSVLRDIQRSGQKEVDVAAAEKRLDALVPKEDPAFLKWAADKIGSMFGDPSIKVGGRKVPMSLENLVDAMSTRNVRGKEKTMTFGGGRLAAEASKRFKSIEEIQAERDRVVSPDEHNASVKSADANLEAYRTSVLAFFTQKDYRGDIDTWAGLDAATKALADAAKKGGGEQSIRSALIRNGFRGVNARTVSLAKQALDSVKQAKVDYFEAKPQRGVKLNEFMGAVIPAKTSPEARAILEKNGLRIAEYDGTPEGRAKALDSLSSDLEQQRPGVLFQPAYHGSPYRFDKFTLDHIGSGEGAQAFGYGLYFASEKSVAQYYRKETSAGKYARKDGTTFDMYKELDSPNVRVSLNVAGGDVDAALEKAKSLGNPLAQHDAQVLEKIKAEGGLKPVESQLYKVEIPEDHQLLLWDKPLSEQPEEVRKALEDQVSAGKSLWAVFPGKDPTLLYAEEELLGVSKEELALAEKTVKKGGGKVVRAIDLKIDGKDLYQDLSKKLGSDRAASEYLNNIGIKGIKYLDGTSRADGEGSHNYVIFDDKAVQIAKTYYQELMAANRSGTKGSITFDPEQVVIRLFKGNADFSTLLHETAHYFVREMQNMVDTGRAPEQVLKDLETMAKFAGDLEGVPAQEKLARAFELYLREGKAPSPEMVKPFQRFQAWLTAIYRNVKSQLGLEEVPTEMRGVFDRMLAADDEIRMAEGIAGRKAELESVAKGYLTAGEQKRLKDLNTKASSDAKEKLTKKYLKAYFKALGGKTELEKQARAEVESQQVYSTISDIAQKGWLSFDALAKEYGEKVTRELSFRFPGLVAQEGVLPRHTFDLGTIAIAHGYDGAESMMADILGAKAKGTSIKELTEQKIAAEESRVLDGLNPNAAEEIHNDASLSALILEGLALQRKAVEKGAQTRKINSEAIKQVTQAILADMPVSKAGVYTRFSSAARRASEEARKAIAVGDWEKAATAKQREALNHALVIEAVKARDMVAKQVKTIIREAKAKKLDFEAREQILALTSTYGIGPRGMKPTKPEELTGIRDYFAKVYGAEDDLAMNPVGFFNDWSLNREQLGSYKNLTVSQMNELHALVSALADAGGSEYTRMASEATMTRQAQLDKMIESVNNSGYQTKQYDRGTTTQKATSAFRDVMASLQRMPDLFRNADGNVDAAPKNAHLMGPNQEFAERLHLGNRKALEILYSHKDLPEIEAAKVAFAKRFKKQFGERTPEVNGVPVPPVRKVEGMHTWTAESIWCVALNMGNEGNLRTLIQGDGLTMDQLVKLTSVLSERDWKAIQAQWDLLGKYYAETDKVFRKVYNFPMPNRVKPKELTVRTAEGNDLTLPGGYFPIKVDRDINPDIGAKQEQDLIKGDPSNKFAASIAKGHTKERLGTSRPVSLSYEVAHRAMLDQARFIALAPIIKDAQAIYTSPEYRRAMIDAFGKEAYDGILPWLKNIASPTIEGKDHFDNALSKMRHLSTLYILGLNLKSATKQYLGLAGTANKLGVKWTASGLTEMAKWGGMGKDFVDEKSAFMRNREEGLNPELAEINAKARGNEFRLFGIKTGLPKKKVVDAVMVLTRLTDRHVTYSTWLGAYKKGLQEMGMADAEAVDFADRIVRRTQMSGSAVDTTGWQRSEGAKRLLTMFMSEAIPKSSRMRSDFTAFKNGNMTAAQYGRSLFYETIAPAVGYTALMGLMGGEDKKSWFKDLFWQLYSETFGLFPLLGGVQSAVEFNKPVAGTPSLEALDIFTNVVKAGIKLHDDHSSEGKARMYKALIDATAYMHGVGNLRRIYETAAEGWKDIDHNKTVNPFRLFIRKPKDQ